MANKDYLIKSDGEWNNPSISSRILHINNSGYIPKFHGGCMGIIPNGDKYCILGEDDDHYFDICNLNEVELLIFKNILKQLSESVDVKIDYIKCSSKTKYFPSKSAVFNRNYSFGNFIVNITDRGKSSPLVSIRNNVINFEMTFDISWAKHKYQVCENAINNK